MFNPKKTSLEVVNKHEISQLMDFPCHGQRMRCTLATLLNLQSDHCIADTNDQYLLVISKFVHILINLFKNILLHFSVLGGWIRVDLKVPLRGMWGYAD